MNRENPASEMRILALLGSVHPYGSERANLEVLDALREKGATVRVIVNQAGFAAEMRNFVTARGFDTVAAPHIETPKPYNKIRPLIDLPIGIVRGSIAFLMIHRDFKPTHVHACSQAWVLNFALALAWVRTPMVYRCGDAPILHNATWRAVWRFVVWRASRFVAVSQFIAGRMTAAGAAADKITVIYSRPPRRLAVPAGPKKEKTFNIGFVGQVIEGKGVAVLVAAFEEIAVVYPQARLLIAGRIRDDWHGEPWGVALRDATMANPLLAGRVEFLGQVEDVPGFLSRCQILVAPTLTEEPMGNVVMEAKEAGLASIIFRSGGFPEVIEHAVTGYVCAEKSAETLAVALRAYLDDPARAAAEGRAAKASLSKLGVDAFAERWEQVYAEAAR